MSDFNSLPSELSPILTDKVFTARGIAGGAERQPTLQKVLQLFAANGGGISTNSAYSMSDGVNNVTNVEQFSGLFSPEIPAGTYILIGRYFIRGTGLTINPFTVYTSIYDALGNLLQTEIFTDSFQGVSAIEGIFHYVPIQIPICQYSTPAAKFGVYSSINPSLGSLDIVWQMYSIPIVQT